MLTRIKKTVGEDDFSYFIRYFGLFTLIFSAMTLIIIQVMRSSLYTTVDENLKTLSQDPYSLVAIAYRDQRQSNTKGDDNDHEMMIPDHDKSEPKGDVTSNTTVVLLNKKYENLTTGNGFLNFKTVTFGRKLLNKVSQLQITNSYGKKESYRAYMAELSLSDDESDSDIKYAVVMTNISQLEQTSEEHESQIALIMICFWGIPDGCTFRSVSSEMVSHCWKKYSGVCFQKPRGGRRQPDFFLFCLSV